MKYSKYIYFDERFWRFEEYSKCSICWSWSMNFLEFSTFVTPFCKNFAVSVDVLMHVADYA